MQNLVKKLKDNEVGNYILPFLWMKGEDQTVIRTEIEKIYECGIRAICVEARPHPEFGKAGWWKDLGVVLEEAERLNIKVWILDDKHFPTGYANGLIAEKYPERKKVYLNYNVCDINGTGEENSIDINQMKAPGVVFWELDKKINFEERAKNKVKKVLLIKLAAGKRIYEGCQDVTELVDEEGVLTIQIPAGAYRIMTVYTTCTDGGSEDYINLLDETSCYTQLEAVYIPHYEHFKDKFGTTIAGFFSDEPQFGNEPLFPCDSIVGKERMPIPWSEEAEIRMKEVFGDNWGSYLPYLWMNTKEMEQCPRLRYEYMNIVSRLYQKNFSNLLGNWCSEHGVEYIGHVVEDNNVHSRLGMGAAHYFRAMDGQHMAGIDVIGGQIAFGAPEQTRHNMVDIDGEFFQYVLGKLGASSAHLDPKKKGRLMCELFGATGWRTGVKEMRFILDHMLAQGVNYLVPHAFSMAKYPDPDCPPHFYARGNYPEYTYFKELMLYANRMCELLNDGRHKASVAILYDAELEWSGSYTPMQKVSKILMEHQIDFDIAAIDMLTQPERYQTEVKEGKLIVNGIKFEALVIPPTQRIPMTLAEWIAKHLEIDVIFLDYLPECIVNTSKSESMGLLQKIAGNVEVVSLKQLPSVLKAKGFYDVELKEEYAMLTVYHYEKEQGIYMFINESAEETYCGTILLYTDKALVVYEGLGNQFFTLETVKEGDRQGFTIELLPGQSVVVMESVEEARFSVYKSVSEKLKQNTVIQDISSDWEVSSVRAIEYPNFSEKRKLEKLIPYSRIDDTFSGIIAYEKAINMNPSGKVYFRAQHVNDVMQLWVNGTALERKIAEPFVYDITEAVKEGDNQIRVEVATTLEREQVKYPAPPFTFGYESKLPTGMYGEIQLIAEK
jgi:hypothetical protein